VDLARSARHLSRILGCGAVRFVRAHFAWLVLGATACGRAQPTTPRPTNAPATRPVTPVESVAPVAPVEQGLIVDVPDSGDVIVDGTAVADALLRDHFAKQSADRVAIIRAAEGVRWERVIRVLDALRGRPNRGGEFVLALRDDAKRRSSTIRFPLASQGFLPRALGDDSPPSDVQVVLTISITREGQRSVDGTSVTGSLLDALRARVTTPPPNIVVRADRESPFGIVLDAVLAAQAVGANIAFSVSLTPSFSEGEPSGASAVATAPSSPSAPKPTLRPKGFPKCDFPPEADADEIDSAAVTVRVRVDAAGKVTDVAIVSDAGHGFAAAAKACTLKARFAAARDEKGKAIAGEVVMRVRFER
jgi:TonB family protein